MRNYIGLIKMMIISLLAALMAGSLSGCGGDGSSADIDYVALGASDATGVGAIPITKGYVFQIQDDLEESGKSANLLNLGIPDADITDIFHDESKVAEQEDPDLITLFTGANDIIDGVAVADFEQTLNDMLGDLTQDTHAFIVIATLPDISQTPRFIQSPSAKVTSAIVAQFNEAIIRQANNFNVAIVDLSHDSVGENVTSEDGFHPNNDGYTIIANAFLKVIEPHFAATPAS